MGKEICTDQAQFTSPKQFKNMLVGFAVRSQQGIDFFH